MRVFIEELMQNNNFKNDIPSVYTNYKCLAKTIRLLEIDGKSLLKSIAIIDDIYSEISSVMGNIGNDVTNKLDNVVKK